jgi:leucyl aminopeptidase
MKIQPTASNIFSQAVPAIVIFSFEGQRLTAPTAAARKILGNISPKEFKGAEKQTFLLHTHGPLRPKRILLVGLGKKDKFTAETLRRAAGIAATTLRDRGVERYAVEIRDEFGTASVRAVVEATKLALYKFSEFKPADEPQTEIKTVTICASKSALTVAKNEIARAALVADAANFARGIGNLPGNVIYPETLADHAQKLAREFGLKCEIFDKKRLQAGKFGGLLAVGGGSAREPRLIVLEYRGKNAPNSAPIALVGKAITFDSGGISIKPSEKMDEMKFDKCGGVAVLGAMRAAAALKLPLSVIGVIAAAENMPSATSYRPGDILTSHRGGEKRGVTIEVLNTDAEGRIVLGDALAFARSKKPQAIIDFATLTGACVVALGSFCAGLMGNDEKLQQKIRAAGEATGERVWPLPLWDEYRDKIKSDVADIKNTGGREAGAITAAAFLDKYVGDTPWAHLDIAGTAWTTEKRAYLDKGATGFGVRLTAELLSNWA